MENTSNGNLPVDVIQEILLRLPVKTLLRFKCVCKHWCALIGSPSFVNQHFGHESNQEHLLIRYCAPKKGDVYSLYVHETFTRYEVPDHLRMPNGVSALMGPLNGIFCVVGIHGSMALLNPAMRQFKPLPLLHPNVQPHLSSYRNMAGFGLDPLSGDYKFVSIQYFWNEEMDVPHYPSLVSVYNSGSDSWRHFEDVDLVNSSHCGYRSLCNTYLNGVYYWLIEFNDADAAILAFDMSSEKFQEIQVPDCIKSKGLELALFGDLLALLTFDLDKTGLCIEVWTMNNEGCWIKSSGVGPFQDLRRTLGFWKKNELLFETIRTSLLAVCNVSTKKFRVFEARRTEYGFLRNEAFFYKESLASIKREGDKCELWDTSSDFVKDFFKYSSSNR